jgi:hypothetical protein
MTQGRTQPYFLPADRSITREFSAGVSPHSHTSCFSSASKVNESPKSCANRKPNVVQATITQSHQSHISASFLERP